jgi:hypothetical protein
MTLVARMPMKSPIKGLEVLAIRASAKSAPDSNESMSEVARAGVRKVGGGRLALIFAGVLFQPQIGFWEFPGILRRQRDGP